MAFTFSLNNIMNRTCDTMLLFKNTWKLHSATVLQSGDGDAIGPANLADLNGDVLTVASSSNGTPNNINNINAWMRIQLPNGQEFVIQHAVNVTQQDYRVWYSAAAGFVEEALGSVDEEVRPTASDEAQILGSSPNGSNEFFSADIDNPSAFPDFEARTVLNMCFGDADEGYSFYALTSPQGNQEWKGGMIYDALEGAPAYVEHPYVVGVLGNSSNLGSIGNIRGSLQRNTPPNTGNAFAWFPKVSASPSPAMRSCCIMGVAGRVTTAFRYHSDNSPYPDLENENALVTSAIHGGYDSLGMGIWAIQWNGASNSARFAVLGRSRLFRTFVQAGYHDMTDDLLWRIIGGIGVRWDGSTEPRIS